MPIVNNIFASEFVKRIDLMLGVLTTKTNRKTKGNKLGGVEYVSLTVVIVTWANCLKIHAKIIYYPFEGYYLLFDCYLIREIKCISLYILNCLPFTVCLCPNSLDCMH